MAVFILERLTHRKNLKMCSAIFEINFNVILQPSWHPASRQQTSLVTDKVVLFIGLRFIGLRSTGLQSIGLRSSVLRS